MSASALPTSTRRSAAMMTLCRASASTGAERWPRIWRITRVSFHSPAYLTVCVCYAPNKGKLHSYLVQRFNFDVEHFRHFLLFFAKPFSK